MGGKYGIIRGMKKRGINAMIATALSIFAVAASCMASDASADTLRGGGRSSSPKPRSGFLRAA